MHDWFKQLAKTSRNANAEEEMVKKIKQLFCDHRKVVHYRTDLVRQDDGSWKTVHKWKCKKCGKVIRNDNI